LVDAKKKKRVAKGKKVKGLAVWGKVGKLKREGIGRVNSGLAKRLRTHKLVSQWAQKIGFFFLGKQTNEKSCAPPLREERKTLAIGKHQVHLLWKNTPPEFKKGRRGSVVDSFLLAEKKGENYEKDPGGTKW